MRFISIPTPPTSVILNVVRRSEGSLAIDRRGEGFFVPSDSTQNDGGGETKQPQTTSSLLITSVSSLTASTIQIRPAGQAMMPLMRDGQPRN